jgi:hypothetical protein
MRLWINFQWAASSVQATHIRRGLTAILTSSLGIGATSQEVPDNLGHLPPPSPTSQRNQTQFGTSYNPLAFQ